MAYYAFRKGAGVDCAMNHASARFNQYYYTWALKNVLQSNIGMSITAVTRGGRADIIEKIAKRVNTDIMPSWQLYYCEELNTFVLAHAASAINTPSERPAEMIHLYEYLPETGCGIEKDISKWDPGAYLSPNTYNYIYNPTVVELNIANEAVINISPDNLLQKYGLYNKESLAVFLSFLYKCVLNGEGGAYIKTSLAEQDVDGVSREIMLLIHTLIPNFRRKLTYITNTCGAVLRRESCIS